MIAQTVVIQAIAGHTVTVSPVSVLSGCSSCAQAEGCGAKKISSWLGERSLSLTLELEQAPRLKVGQKLKLAMAEQRIPHASFWVYIFPLLGAFAAVALVNWLGMLTVQPIAEWLDVLSALGGGVVSAIIAKVFLAKQRTDWFAIDLLDIFPYESAEQTSEQRDGDCAQIIVKSRL